MDELRLLDRLNHRSAIETQSEPLVRLFGVDDGSMNELDGLTRALFGQRQTDAELIDIDDAARGAHFGAVTWRAVGVYPDTAGLRLW